jgi:hypothetical protein
MRHDLHSFQGSDGSEPVVGLTKVNSILYGVAGIGGTNGAGSAFSVRP